MKKIHIKMIVIALAMLTGAALHTYMEKHREGLDRFILEYGKKIGDLSEEESN